MLKTYSNKNDPKKSNPQNFLEALKNLGQSTVSEVKTQVKKAVVEDVPQAFGLKSASGTLNPSESVSINNLGDPEKQAQARESAYRARLMQIREEEQAQIRRQEVTLREQIRSVQDELRQLAQVTGQFSQEIQTATFQATVNPGLYHKNFFTHLRSIIATLRKRVSESNSWLAEFNSRSRKRGYYWDQVSKSGTKYLLSSERYMVTSTG